MSRYIRPRDIELSPQERQTLISKIRQINERKFADRLRVVLYKSDGLPNRKIACFLQIGINQVTKILKRYLKGGVDALLEKDNYKGSTGRLSGEQIESLKFELKTKIYHTAAQVIRWVEEQWNISFTLRGMHKLLKRMRFTYKKNKLIPSKADPKKQVEFVRWFSQARANLGPDDRIYFSDAMHLKHNAEAGYGWSAIGEPHLIPSNSGRKRINILGAYCTQTHEHVFIITEENINQDKIIELLKKLRKQHGEKGEIHIVMDNASYNRANRVFGQALISNIILKHQPSYSPNLNLIERLWKFVRQKFSRDKYRETFAVFCANLIDFFAKLDENRAKLVTLLREKFEVLLDVQVFGVGHRFAQVAGGKWQVAGGRWQVAGGRWQVAGGRWQVAGGRWQMADGRSQVAGGRVQEKCTNYIVISNKYTG